MLGFETSWAWNKVTVLLYSIQYWTVKYTKAKPLVEDAHMGQCTPDMWTNLCVWMNIRIFEGSQLEGSYVRDLLYYMLNIIQHVNI